MTLVRMTRKRCRAWLSINVGWVLVVLAACGGSPATPVAAQPDPVRLSFASADFTGSDSVFMRELVRLSGGRVQVTLEQYDDNQPEVDVQIARDLLDGRLDLADVGARAWESVGEPSLRAYQYPFLITTREQLVEATGPEVSGPLLSTLAPGGVHGLAALPIGLRYLFSTRVQSGEQPFVGSAVRVNTSPTTAALLRQLGATVAEQPSSGAPVIAALADGTLTAVEADIRIALGNGYVAAAPHVLVDVPVFGKVTTLVGSSRRLDDLDAEALEWVKQSALAAAENARDASGESSAWLASCAVGLQASTVGPVVRAALIARAEPVRRSIEQDPAAAAAVAAIRRLGDGSPDPSVGCRG